MPGKRLTLWTDVALETAGRELLEPDAEIFQAPAGSLERIEEADGIIAGSLLPGNADLFARATKLQVIARVGIGYDNIDLSAATAAGVCAVNTPFAPTESTAEFTMALILAVARRIVPAHQRLRTGEWNQTAELKGFDLAGKTLGLIGCGRIGARVAEIALAFRMRVLAVDPRPSVIPAGIEFAPSLDRLLAISDVVSVHVPLLPETRQLLNTRTLSLMKKGAVLINASRGPVVDEAALQAALESGHLGGAGLDVWDPEPPQPDNPLFRLSNVVATPHMAAFTQEGRTRSHGGAALQVLQVWRGERPAALLNPEVWSRRRNGTGKVSS